MLNKFETESHLKLFPFYMNKGDLTDAKDQDHLGSRQYEEEWKTYHKILEDANVRNKTIWMDLRGNHGLYIWLFILPIIQIIICNTI